MSSMIPWARPTDHYFHTTFVLFFDILKSGDVHMYGRTETCTKITISTGRVCGSAEWINNISSLPVMYGLGINVDKSCLESFASLFWTSSVIDTHLTARCSFIYSIYIYSAEKCWPSKEEDDKKSKGWALSVCCYMLGHSIDFWCVIYL